MALFQARVSTPRPPQEVFAYLADFRSVAEWDPGVLRARRVDAGPLAEGSLFDVSVAFLGRSLELRYRVLDHQPPRHIVLEAQGPGFRSHDVIRVEAEGSGARVDYDALLDLRGVARALDPALQLAFDRVGRDAAQGLARALGGHWREEREGRTLVPRLWVAREIEASAGRAWERLLDARRWTAWSPSLAEVESDRPRLGPGARGRLRLAYGPWLPFEVDVFRPGREWGWRVAGLPATTHRVSALGQGLCRVELGVPLPAAPYLAVCREALERLAAELAKDAARTREGEDAPLARSVQA